MGMGLAIVGIALVLVIIRAKTTHFVCSKCRSTFKTSFVNYMFTPQLMGKRKVKCPNCGHSESLAPQYDKKK